MEGNIKYTTNEIREAVIAELKERNEQAWMILTVKHVLDAAFKRLPDRLPDDTSGQLLSFFLWFRANGELHIDKSIEAMIDIYLKESNLR